MVLRHTLRRLGANPLPGGSRGHREPALAVRALPGPTDGPPPERLPAERLRRRGQGLLLTSASSGGRAEAMPQLSGAQAGADARRYGARETVFRLSRASLAGDRL